jgi:DNA repair protein RadC
LLCNASKIIIAHNHPSNNLNPSQEDLNIYDKLKEGGELLGIKVLDNIIFNKKGFYSTK